MSTALTVERSPLLYARIAGVFTLLEYLLWLLVRGVDARKWKEAAGLEQSGRAHPVVPLMTAESV